MWQHTKLHNSDKNAMAMSEIRNQRHIPLSVLLGMGFRPARRRAPFSLHRACRARPTCAHEAIGGAKPMRGAVAALPCLIAVVETVH